MKNILLLLISLSCIGLNAQTNREIPIGETNNIVVNTNSTVYIYKAYDKKVIIKGSESETNSVIVNSNSEGLTIQNGKGKNNNLIVEVYTNNLNNITVSGQSTIILMDEFTLENLTLVAAGASDFKGTIYCNKATITASGSSDIDLAGSANTIDAVASGSSDLKLLNMPVKQMNLNVSGASDAYVDVTDELNAVASGASDVYYKSEPTKLNGNTSGESDIRLYNGNQTQVNNFSNNSYSDQDSTKTKGRFAARPKDMFGGGRMHQDLVWMGIDLGMDGLVDLSNGVNFQPQGDYQFMEMNYWRNTHVRINFFEWRFNLVKNVFNIVTGMGWDFQHYAFAQKIKFDEANDYPGQTFPTPVIGVSDTVHSINRSRLAVQYFNIPLFFNLRTKKTAKNKNQFNFTFGVVGGIKTGSSSRIQYTELGYDAEEEKRDDFNLETFTATAMVRIKYSFFSIYASYQFTPMFRGQNPNLYPFSLGVTLLSW